MSLILTHQNDVQHDRGSKTLLDRVMQLIRKAPTPELQTIFTVAAEEVRRFLATDRVKIYQFHGDGSGEVVAESLRERRLPSLLGLHFPAGDIPYSARKLFVMARMRAIADVARERAGKSCSNDLEGRKHAFKEIHYQPLDPCHAEYLTAMGVQSSLVVPLLHNETLWGLLVSHHAEANTIGYAQLEDVQRVVDLLSVAIAQADLLQCTREKAAREASLNQISAALPNLQKALETTVEVFQGSGGRLYIRRDASDFQTSVSDGEAVRLYTYGVEPVFSELSMFPMMEQYSVWQRYFQNPDRLLWAIADLYDTPELRSLQSAFRSTAVGSILMIPLRDGDRIAGYLSIFRDKIDTETLWAGQVNLDPRQNLPRESFKAWKETKMGQVRSWTAGELKLAQSLSARFSTAVRQHEMDKQIRSLHVYLEQQVEERTEQLQQAFDRQQALFEGVAKIRESLDLKTIFQTTTREARQLLNTDRVAIYRFRPDWSGEFVAESVVDSGISLLEDSCQNPKLHHNISDCSRKYWADTYLQKVQEDLFPPGVRFLSCDDIYNGGLSDCHIQVLESYQAKAYVVIAIYKQNKIWGLLATYQNSGPRHWKSEDIRFLEQISLQISVAIQQADLLAKQREQAQQLEQTIAHLQKTQAQLVQTEKMSSLGQLVAGMSHEINNPVNFIYGNLIHTETYVKDIVDLLTLYQKHCYTPHSDIVEHMEDIELDFLVQDLPKMLSSMKIGADRIRKIVQSLRNFSRLDEAECKDVDLHEGIESTLSILQHQLKTKSSSSANLKSPRSEIQVIREYAQLPLVECYAGQLNQVFMNILSNAIDAIEQRHDVESEPYQGKIEILTKVVKKSDDLKDVVVRISDNGLGISDSVKARIFDPFFTTKPVGQGTGLGLSVSYQIVVEKHGGMFECQSKPGQGTQFEIAIPVRSSDRVSAYSRLGKPKVRS